MNDREILLRAICALPDDDAPRLAYADWLDENGDPRQAEFIRVQVALAPLNSDDPTHAALIERELALWRELKKWRYILGNWLNLSLLSFKRGFNMHWMGNDRDLLQQGDTFWRFGPVTDANFAVHTKTSQGSEAGAAIGACPILQQFRTVTITNRVNDDWLTALLQSPYIGGWRQLYLYSALLTDLSCIRLADSDLAKNGCSIHVSSSHISAVAQALLKAIPKT